MYTLAHAHKSRSRFLTQDHTGTPRDLSRRAFRSQMGSSLLKKEEEKKTSITLNLKISFSFVFCFSDQGEPLMLSSVLDWPNLAQLLHRSNRVTLYECFQNPAQAYIQCSLSTSACKAVWEACMSIPSLYAPVPLHCHHVSCLLTSRLSCSHTGTCGFKCDPDLNRGQGGGGRGGGKGGMEERERVRRETESSQYPT